MAENAASTDAPTAPPKTVAALRRFAKVRGGGATAVIEYLGARGARIVLVGADGGWGDQVVKDGVEAAAAACEAAGVPVKDDWERELVAGMKTSGFEWGLMGRGRPLAGGGTR